jgi:NYN domain
MAAILEGVTRKCCVRGLTTTPRLDFKLAIPKIQTMGGHHLTYVQFGGTAPVVEDEVRSFYYDCLDEEQRENEGVVEYQERLSQQTARLRALREVHGCHIRLGSLKGTKTRRQKEVDVLMAVDMMAHAARGNMDTAVLVAGDLDFRPAVEALVQLGISVHVISDEKTTATELMWAASAYSSLSFDNFYDWTNAEQKDKCPTPSWASVSPPGAAQPVKQGVMNGRKCSLLKNHDKYYVFFPAHAFDETHQYRTFSHENLERLELYFKLRGSPIVWSE